MTRNELIQSLKNALAAAEKLPDFRCYASVYVRIFPASAAEFRAMAPALIPFEKPADSMNYSAEHQLWDGELGTATLALVIDRGKMCRKVKVLKEVEEYQCDDSILDPTAEPVRDAEAVS